MIPAQQSSTDKLLVDTGIKAFFLITQEWGLNHAQQRILLGNPSAKCYREWKAGKINTCTIPIDLLDRLSHLLGIYKSLKIMHSPGNQKRFLHNRSHVAHFFNKSPLDCILSGDLVALADLNQYLNTQMTSRFQ